MLKALLGLGVVSAVAANAETSKPAISTSSGPVVIFTQRDTVVDFNPGTGVGLQVGTVDGRIVGTSVVNFQFTPTSQTDITFLNKVIITDLDGDQILFDNAGSGKFIVPPLSDPSSPLGNLFGVGGSLSGTYKCLKASGKYTYLVGRVFPYRSIATNPARAGFPGQVYVEVYSDRFDVQPV